MQRRRTIRLRPLPRTDQPRRKFEGINRPILPRPRTTDALPPCLGAAVKQLPGPARGDGIPAMDGTKQCATDCRIGIRVAAAHDAVHHPLFQVRRMDQLSDGVPERNQDPALLVHVVRRRCLRCEFDSAAHRLVHVPFP